jgi:hypothetical protein
MVFLGLMFSLAASPHRQGYQCADTLRVSAPGSGLRWPHPGSRRECRTRHASEGNAQGRCRASARCCIPVIEGPGPTRRPNRFQRTRMRRAQRGFTVACVADAACALLGVLPGKWQAAGRAHVAPSGSKSSCQSIGESCVPFFWNACQDYEAPDGV